MNMSKKNLYVIGARGFGRECIGYFRLWDGFLDRYNIVGFLDDKQDALDGYEGYPPIVNSVENFMPKEDDVFLCALGVVKWREVYSSILLNRGAKFDTFISPKATVHRSASIGNGCLILDNTLISSDSKLGDFALCHVGVSIGHDVKLGNDVVCEAQSFCGGFVKVGNRVTLHTRATVLPHKKIGDDAVVGAGSVVISNVRSGKTVFGVPALPIDV